MISIVFMVAMPLLMVGVKLVVPLAERRHAPRIYKLAPNGANVVNLHIFGGYQVVGIHRVRAKLIVARAIGIEVVCDNAVGNKIFLKVCFQLCCSFSPARGIVFLAHIVGKTCSRIKLTIP